MASRPKKTGPRDAQGGPAPEPRTYSEGAQNILITAERLFGEYGLNGVSMRQILLAAGHGNKAGVYHHFGSKEGLIQAVFDMRMPSLDEARRMRLQAAEQKGPIGVKELLEALLLPVADIPESESRHACARFLLQLVHRPHQHPVLRWRDHLTAALEIDRRLRDQLAYLPPDVFLTRFRLIVALFLTGIAWPDLRTPRATQGGAVYEADLIAMAAAAFQAPLPAGDEAAQPLASSPDKRPVARRSTRSTRSGKPK